MREKGDYFMIVFTTENAGSKSSSTEDLEGDSETSKDGQSEQGKHANKAYRQTNITFFKLSVFYSMLKMHLLLIKINGNCPHWCCSCHP